MTEATNSAATAADDQALVKLIEEATQFAAAGLHDFLIAAARVRALGRTLSLTLEIDANGSLSVEPKVITPPAVAEPEAAPVAEEPVSESTDDQQSETPADQTDGEPEAEHPDTDAPAEHAADAETTQEQ